MLRLVLDWYQANASPDRRLVLEQTATWYSEARMPSRFFPKYRGDARGEGWTHADAVVGQFRLRPARGDIELHSDASQLTIVEAKMASALSAGTKYAPAFDQAARNVACMAQVLSIADRRPEHMSRVEFFVFAPGARISEQVFSNELDKQVIARKVRDRAGKFGQEHAGWVDDWFMPTLGKCTISAVAWEDLIAEIAAEDKIWSEALGYFYADCLRYNPIVSASQRNRSVEATR